MITSDRARDPKPLRVRRRWALRLLANRQQTFHHGGELPVDLVDALVAGRFGCDLE